MNEIEKILNSLNITQNYYLIGLIIGLLLCFIMLYFFHRRYRKKEESQVAEGHLETIMELLDEINNIYHIIENKRHALNIYTGKTQEKTFKAVSIIDEISRTTKESQQILDEGEQLIQDGKNLKKVEENIMSAEAIIEEINNTLLKDVDAIQDELQQMESGNTEKINSVQKELENIYADLKEDNPKINNMITDIRIILENISQKQVEGDVYTSYLMLQNVENLLLTLKHEIGGVSEYESPEGDFTFIPSDSSEEDINFPEPEVKEEIPEQQQEIEVAEDALLPEQQEASSDEEFSLKTFAQSILPQINEEEFQPAMEEKVTERIQRLKEKEQEAFEDEFLSVQEEKTEEFVPRPESEETLTTKERPDVGDLEQLKSVIDKAKIIEEENKETVSYKEETEEIPSPELKETLPEHKSVIVGELERLKSEISKVKSIVDKAITTTQSLTNTKVSRKDSVMSTNQNLLNTTQIYIDKEELRVLNEKKIAALLTELNNVKHEIVNISQNEFTVLVKSFVPPNWADVSEHLMNADKLMSDSANLIDASLELNSKEIEKFYRADINLQRAEQKLNQAKVYCKEIKDKLNQLMEYRKEAKILWNKLVKVIKILQEQTSNKNGDERYLQFKNTLTNLVPSLKQIKIAFNSNIPYDYLTTNETLDELNKKVRIIYAKIKKLQRK